jgi:ribosomal protein S18 acetylase RimI-like enzyme
VRFRIRQFKKADFPTLWQIDQACFEPQLAYSQAELAFYMRRPGSFTLVAEEEAAIEGDKVNEGDKVKDRGEGGSAGGERGSAGEIAESGILGFIVAENRHQTGHIITIDVIDWARRTGVGSALLEATEGKLLRAGATSVALETPVNNAAAIRFYKSEGYYVEKTVAGYYSNQMDALVMTKELAGTA